MADVTGQSRQQASERETCVSGNGSILGNWKLWLVLAAGAVAAGAVFNWTWLVAAGAAPVLLSVLPCVAMCVLHLCGSKGDGGDCAGQGQPASRSRAVDAARTIGDTS